MLSLLTNDIDDIIDGNTTNDLAVCVDDRRRDQVVQFEAVGDFTIGHVGFERLDVKAHDLGHDLREVACDESGQRQHAKVLGIAIDDDQCIRVCRNPIPEPSQKS